MDIITRAQAKKLGLKKYFTGKPCKHGHTVPRLVDAARCEECFAIMNRKRALQWQKDNPERYRDRQRKYREENREILMAYGREYYKKNAERYAANKRKKRQENPERIKQQEQSRRSRPEEKIKAKVRTREWRKKNPDRYKEQVQAWKKRNPERAKAIVIAGTNRRRARKKAAGGNVTAAQIREIRARCICAACGKTSGPMHVDHIIPLSKGGLHDVSNLQLLCERCNVTKWAKLPEEWQPDHATPDTE